MEFRTIIKPGHFDHKISYETPVFLTGSCFAGEIGSYFTRGKMDVLVNPFGVLYNPLSVAGSITRIVENRKFSVDELYRFNDRYISLHHGTSFSSVDPDETLARINDNLIAAAEKLKAARFIFVTFGTARVYILKESGQLVSNCHKIPGKKFTRELLETEMIVDVWGKLIKRIRSVNSNINIVFTVSPVRHWKDGAHGNQVSKSILFIAIEKLLFADRELSYFPSYELLIDDLRDYRYYKDDMLHPSAKAVEYIWEHFSDTYFTSETKRIYKEASKIITATRHRVMDENSSELIDFCKTMVSRIDRLISSNPGIDMTREKEYFRNLGNLEQ